MTLCVSSLLCSTATGSGGRAIRNSLQTKSDTRTLGEQFFAKSWCRIPFDADLFAWVHNVLPIARQTRFEDANQEWVRCGETWFVGVNALPNDTDGAVEGGLTLSGNAVDFLRDELNISPLELEPAQVSICYPGYPQPMDRESAAAFQFRRDNFAAHIDGILPEGEARRRHLREHHRFILGIPLTKYDAGSAPLVVWQGSHEIVRNALQTHFGDRPPETWGDVDITEIYHALRNRIFAECNPVSVIAEPGEAYVVHRLALHGIEPWRNAPESGPEDRVICYFRPETTSPNEWLNAP